MCIYLIYALSYKYWCITIRQKLGRGSKTLEFSNENKTHISQDKHTNNSTNIKSSEIVIHRRLMKLKLLKIMALGINYTVSEIFLNHSFQCLLLYIIYF